MKSIKELVEEYNVELVFTTLHKELLESEHGVIFVNQNLSTEEQEEAISRVKACKRPCGYNGIV